jgi:DNA-binding MarR family transcriptional regulator
MATLKRPTPPSERSRVATGLVRLMQAMEGLYTRESRKAGLTAQQSQLLCAASHRRGGVGEIAEVLRCDRSNVSRLLDRMTDRGLAYRGSADRDGRVAVVKLSDDGRALVEGFEGKLEARLARLVADWPAEKRDAAADALLALVEAIQEDMRMEDAAAEEATAQEPGARAG